MKGNSRHAPDSRYATKRELRELDEKTQAGFDDLVETLSAALKLMRKEMLRNTQGARGRGRA